MANETLQKLFDHIMSKDDQISYLQYRWDDEKEYEDFQGYVTAMEKLLAPYKLVKMKKSFELLVEADGQPFKVILKKTKIRVLPYINHKEVA